MKIGENQKVSKVQIKKIRQLDDFDLIMLISEIHDHGWQVASTTLEMMPDAKTKKYCLVHPELKGRLLNGRCPKCMKMTQEQIADKLKEQLYDALKTCVNLDAKENN